MGMAKFRLRGCKAPKRISIKLGIYNYVAGNSSHANPYGGASAWVATANTLKFRNTEIQDGDGKTDRHEFWHGDAL